VHAAETEQQRELTRQLHFTMSEPSFGISSEVMTFDMMFTFLKFVLSIALMAGIGPGPKPPVISSITNLKSKEVSANVPQCENSMERIPNVVSWRNQSMGSQNFVIAELILRSPPLSLGFGFCF
jgi:hypothetical protein